MNEQRTDTQDQGDARRPGTAESTQAPDTPEAEQQAQTSADVAKLQAELDAARKRVNELAYAVKEGQREREEFKERIQRERERLMDLERVKVATALLDTVDELDLCLRAANPADPLAQGVRMIRDGILARLGQTGVERMIVEGSVFNPNEHEAADMELTPNAEDDQKVVAEVRAGYRLKDRVVRPARVKVARYVKPADA